MITSEVSFAYFSLPEKSKSVATAAAAENHEADDKKPKGVVVVKDIAKAVSHRCISSVFPGENSDRRHFLPV